MSQLPPAGWHPDPLARHAQRYWDGNEWTEHVADTAGNMTTDPLTVDGGQATQDSGQAEASHGADQAQADQGAGWGETTQSEEPAQGSSESWGAATAAGGAVGGAVAVGQATHDEPDAQPSDEIEPAHDEHEATSDTHEEPVTAVTLDDLDGDDAGDDDEGPRVMESMDGTVALGAADGAVVVRTDALIATSGVTGTPGDGTEVFDGDGDVWVGRAGAFASVIEIDGGLVVSNAHLVAWSADEDPSETSSGIAGFDGRAFTGQGYVVVATGSGLVLADATQGVQVRSGRLIAHTNGMDVEHGEHIDLRGEGTVFAAAG